MYSLFPVSLLVLLVTHTEIHQSIAGADDTNYSSTYNDAVVWRFKYSLYMKMRDGKGLGIERKKNKRRSAGEN